MTGLLRVIGLVVAIFGTLLVGVLLAAALVRLSVYLMILGGRL